MKLFYSPFSCSLASHIVFREAGLDVELVRAELWTRRIEGGGDLRDLNPMGQVPTLMLDDGRVVTENTVVLTFLADLAPERGLAPPRDSAERYELARWLSLVATEVHKKGLALVFDPTAPDEVKAYGRTSIARPLAVLERHLESRPHLLGATLTVADAYLFWALTIAPHGGIPLDAYPTLRAYHTRILERPAVKTAVRWERDQRERKLSA